MATLILNFIFKKLVGLLLTACIQHVWAYVTQFVFTSNYGETGWKRTPVRRSCSCL